MPGKAMKRHAFSAALLALCLALACAAAEPVTMFGIMVDTQDTAIDFGSTKVKDVYALIELIEAMPNLEKVDLYESRLSNDDMDRLFDGYPQIEFGFTVRVGNHTLRTDATAFSTLHNPKRDTEHKTRDFYALRFCTKLEALDLGHNAITDLSFLLDHPQLKVLILACNDIKDISVLSQLTELEYVELFTNKFTDITPLANLTKLVDLNLSNNDITDLTPLYGLTGLERFRLCMDGYLTNAQREALEAALPNCAIGWKEHPTGEGWREHPRYDVIYRIFHTGVYEPFDSDNNEEEPQ